MEKLFELFTKQLRNTNFSEKIKRYLYNHIDWNNRVICISGSIGVGKTTLLLQYIYENFKVNESVLYASMDNIYFSSHSLLELVQEFEKNGGKYLFLDEVHKYPEWQKEIKKIYDNYPNLKIVFAGSSAMEIDKEFPELSRVIQNYEMRGLSFREYLELEKGIQFPVLKLSDILEHHLEISQDISSKIMPLVEFNNYLKHGYYPFFCENKNLYYQTLASNVNLCLETDLPYTQNVEFKNIPKLKKLLYSIVNNVPFKPNVSSLSENITATRGTIMQYLDYLKKAQILNLLKADINDVSFMAKPEKIYMNNTNLLFALSAAPVDTTNIHETFFYNQVMVKYAVTYTENSDFLVSNHYSFEIGSGDKQNKLIKNLPNSFNAVDGIETGFRNKIPLWMFGFLY